MLKLKTKYGNIEVRNRATFNSIYTEDVSSLIYSRNSEALNELQTCLNDIDQKYTDSDFMLKQDISYEFKIIIDSGTDTGSAYKYISELSDLFSILLYCPIFPDEITVRTKTQDKLNLSLRMYPSRNLNKRTIRLSTQSRSNHSMRITKSNINLEKTLERWLDLSSNYASLVSSIQNNTGYSDLHSTHGELILYATQLEDITLTESPENKVKYKYPINKYASEKLQESIKEILGKTGKEDIGDAIYEIRSEIAHVGRPKKILEKLSLQDRTYLCQYLQMTILGFTLNELGIEKEVISEYQNQIC